MTIRLFGERILEATGSRSEYESKPLPQDDPKVRRPDITRARTLLRWEPRVPLEEGLGETVKCFRRRLEAR